MSLISLVSISAAILASLSIQEKMITWEIVTQKATMMHAKHKHMMDKTMNTQFSLNELAE